MYNRLSRFHIGRILTLTCGDRNLKHNATDEYELTNIVQEICRETGNRFHNVRLSICLKFSVLSKDVRRRLSEIVTCVITNMFLFSRWDYFFVVQYQGFISLTETFFRFLGWFCMPRSINVLEFTDIFYVTQKPQYSEKINLA